MKNSIPISHVVGTPIPSNKFRVKISPYNAYVGIFSSMDLTSAISEFNQDFKNKKLEILVREDQYLTISKYLPSYLAGSFFIIEVQFDSFDCEPRSFLRFDKATLLGHSMKLDYSNTGILLHNLNFKYDSMYCFPYEPIEDIEEPEDTSKSKEPKSENS